MIIASKSKKSKTISSFEWKNIFVSSLGVSLNRVTDRITPGLLDCLSESNVKTLELTTGFLNKSSETEKQLLRLGPIPVFSIHAQYGEGYDFSNLHDNEYLLGIENALKAIRFAGLFDAKVVVFHSSSEPVLQHERGPRINQLKRGLEYLCRESAKADKKIALEFLPRDCLGNNTAELLDIISDFDSATLGVCLDTNHLMENYAKLPDIVKCLGKRLFSLHVSDYEGIDEQHLLPGNGIIDWKGFLNALAEIGYNRPFNYECNFQNCGPVDRIKILEENFNWICSLISN